MRVIALIILFLLFKHHAKAASLECFTDEPRLYSFDIGDQKTGKYINKIDYETGNMAGLTHLFVIKDVSSLKSYDDYLTKRYTVGVPYTITYALKCKLSE